MFSFSPSNAELPLHSQKWTTLCHKVSNGKGRDIFVSHRPFFLCKIIKMFLMKMWANQSFCFIKIPETKFSPHCFFCWLFKHFSLELSKEKKQRELLEHDHFQGRFISQAAKQQMLHFPKSLKSMSSFWYGTDTEYFF